jgi:hypothetical protein
MMLPDKMVEYCQDVLATRVVDLLAGRERISPTDALREFMSTETYELLLDPESYLHLESAEYVLDMVKAEQSGNIERWVEA